MANAHTVNMSTFEEGLDRVMYVPGALEHEPVGPIYEHFPTRFRPRRPHVCAVLS